MKAYELYKALQSGTENIPASQIKLLFCEILGRDFAMLMCSDDDISAALVNQCISARDALIGGKPLAHILSYTYFLGRKFTVTQDVLIPRPETELLVWTLLEEYKGFERLNVLDMCSGSGAIGVSLCAEHPEWCVTLCDISPKALEVSKANAEGLCKGSPVFILSDMFQSVQGRFDLIVSNPPYIRHGDIATLETSVRDFEPHLALDGGDDGLDFYRIIAQSAPYHLNNNGRLALEIGRDEGEDVKSILAENGFCNIEVKKDLAGEDRFVFCTYPCNTKE